MNLKKISKFNKYFQNPLLLLCLEALKMIYFYINIVVHGEWGLTDVCNYQIARVNKYNNQFRINEQ